MCWMELGRGKEKETRSRSQEKSLPITFDVEPVGFQNSKLKCDLPGYYEETCQGKKIETVKLNMLLT